MTVEHRWLVDETPWPDQATLAYGEMVELTTPHPPIPELVRLGPEIVGSRGVIVACLIEQDERVATSNRWRTTCLEPPKGYIVQVGEYSHCVLPQQTEVL
ncbi:hypothetical protein [Streptomyces sp. NPDC088794]|uniref:hypothetical protein n=1 Tax=Streptomyces sp. NPDC088794 TaxID=3365902 RepID=UPI0037F3486B